jgi:hypothetical protein
MTPSCPIEALEPREAFSACVGLLVQLNVAESPQR